MSTTVKFQPKSGIPLPRRAVSSISVLLLALMVASTFVALAHSGKTKLAYADTSSFTFTADGDYGQTSNTTANLQYIGKTVANGGPGASFNLALGDFNYSYPQVPAGQWVTFAQSAQTGLGSTTFPFEMVEGDHDTGDLNALITGMPNQVPNVVAGPSGGYGQEYSFDYPSAKPIARFIMVSPKTSGIVYKKGSANYTWVSQSVVAAQKAGYWVIVGMAEGCLFTNSVSDSQPCINGAQDLFNLLLSQGVDLILQAHVHNFQASKQLAITPANCVTLCCPSVDVTNYNPNCAVNATSAMTRGRGTVIVNTGTGGQSLVNILTSDPKVSYFRALSGYNMNPTYGVSQVTVSATQLTETYGPPPRGSGTFTDGFTISSNPVTPTASSTTTTTVTSTPSVTPTGGTTLAQDDFQRPNQTFWGTASDGVNTWGDNASSDKQFTIANNTGQIAASSITNYYATLGPPSVPDAQSPQVEFTGSINSFAGAHMGAVLLWVDKNNWYDAYIDGSHLIIEKRVNGGTPSQLASTPFPATGGASAFYTLLFSVSGDALSASAWLTGQPQPSSWMVTAADTSLTSSSVGSCGLRVVLQNGTTMTFTSFLATSQS